MALPKENKNSCTLIVLGESQVGKTPFINRFIDNTFQNELLVTVGVDWSEKIIELKSKPVSVRIFDTAGQECYRTITKNMFQRADGIILMYSIKARNSFMTISKWVNDIKEKSKEEVITFLIGNKSDCEKEREVTEEEGKEIALKYEMPFYESSAKLDLNVKNVIVELVDYIFDKKVEPRECSIKISEKNKSTKQCC